MNKTRVDILMEAYDDRHLFAATRLTRGRRKFEAGKPLESTTHPEEMAGWAFAEARKMGREADSIDENPFSFHLTEPALKGELNLAIHWNAGFRETHPDV